MTIGEPGLNYPAKISNNLVVYGSLSQLKAENDLIMTGYNILHSMIFIQNMPRGVQMRGGS